MISLKNELTSIFFNKFVSKIWVKLYKMSLCFPEIRIVKYCRSLDVITLAFQHQSFEMYFSGLHRNSLAVCIWV